MSRYYLSELVLSGLVLGAGLASVCWYVLYISPDAQYFVGLVGSFIMGCSVTECLAFLCLYLWKTYNAR